MIRLIILIAIFFAVYPMIGEGYDQFLSDFNLDGIGNIFSNLIAWMSETVDRLQS
jgi:hypothetical protein|tara:strand:+ start:3133 stop:3297 length:165 start_codon:yes stop_codon:yes gene_type:complete